MHRCSHLECESGVVGQAGLVHADPAMDRAVQVMIDQEERRRARKRAAEQGLTLHEYIARLVRADLESWRSGASPASIPAADAPDTASLPDHDGMYIGEAVAARMNKPAESGT